MRLFKKSTILEIDLMMSCSLPFKMKEIMEQYGSILIATVVCIGVLGLLCQVPFAGRKGLFSGVGVYIEKQMDHAEKENLVFDSYWRKK